MHDRLCGHVSRCAHDGSRVPRPICDLSSRDDGGLPRVSSPRHDVPEIKNKIVILEQADLTNISVLVMKKIILII